MSINKSSLAVTRFQIAGEIDEKKLKQFAFRDISETVDAQSAGFVEFHEPSEPATGIEEIGEFKCLSLRVDKRKIPGAVLSARKEEMFKAWLAERPGLNRVPKQIRNEITEAATLQLLAKTLPVPKVTAAVIEGDILTVFTASNECLEMVDQAHKLITEESERRYAMVTPIDIAARLIGKDIAAALDKSGSSESVLEKIEANTDLGRDFLLWLLWNSEAGQYDIDTHLNSRCVLIDAEGNKVVVTGVPLKNDEIKTALRESKQMIEAGISIYEDENEWHLKLKADTFQIAGYKTPTVKLEREDVADEATENKATFLEKIFLVNRGIQLLEDAFKTYLMARFSGDYNAAEIREWFEG